MTTRFLLGVSVLALGASALVGSSGCIYFPDRVPLEPMPGRVFVPASRSDSIELEPSTSCTDLEARLRADEARVLRLSLEANKAWALRLVEDPGQYCTSPVSFESPFLLVEDVAMEGDGTAEGAQDYTTTNNQVADVDEADLIKNDGQYIYTVAGDSLLILKAWPAAETEVIGRVSVDGYPRRLLVGQDRAVVFSAIGDLGNCSISDRSAPQSDVWWSQRHGWSGLKLQASVFDIQDRTQPKLERVLDVNGELLEARLIDDTVHSVVSFPQRIDSGLAVWPQGLPDNLCEDPLSAEEIEAAFARLAAEHTAQLPQTTLVDFLPGLSDTDVLAGQPGPAVEQLLTECENFYVPQGAADPGYVSVLSFPLDDDQVLGATAVLGNSGTVYASSASVYVAAVGIGEISAYGVGVQDRMVLHKFSLGQHGAAASYRGSGAVPGILIDAFSMDEHEGSLRVATTQGFGASSDLYVLRESDPGPGLEVVGEINDLAHDETIRAVRFDGDRGFVVTFRQTDPLFTFDLSDPHAPALLGELQVPGYSTYLHFMDAEHLLTIGFDALESGAVNGVMLQIFDVTDMASPTLVHRETIGGAGTGSDATHDHLAFTFHPDRGLLALPIRTCDGVNGDSFDAQVTFNGLLLYRVDLDEGFTRVGGVEHAPAGGACDAGLEVPGGRVVRSLFLEDIVCSLSSGLLKVNSIADLDTDLASLVLPKINAEVPVPLCHAWYEAD